ncbi:macro domain-containing protein [Candidatus Dojkabacteria bacterium]|jgi:O-acetyl-ADP-ribose deacetylase (regulator of RNase III)|nr:macro domain-containing protein [Candidatus Dojkabacteria bacterium]
MKIQLIDRNQEMCDEWLLQFKDCEDVIVHCGDFFSLPTDCVISPANSFAKMDGSLDYVISTRLGWQISRKLQIELQKNYDGELLVGQAILVETENSEVPYLISAPTMRVPGSNISNTVNVYLATKAIFQLLKKVEKEYPNLNSITISGLGTGVGRFPFDLCAKQMKEAYNDFWLGNYKFPVTWQEIKHFELLK